MQLKMYMMENYIRSVHVLVDSCLIHITYGVTLTGSNGYGIWPVFLTINEIPPLDRYMCLLVVLAIYSKLLTFYRGYNFAVKSCVDVVVQIFLWFENFQTSFIFIFVLFRFITIN